MKHGSLLGGTLLVAGTTIGGGMLALPVLTSLGGFVPSILIFVLCWLFMAGTGLLFLELSLALGRDANIVTMAKHTLGKLGESAAWIIYLFLFYCLTIAYTVGCGELITEIFPSIPREYGPLVFLIIFSPFVYAGMRVVGKLNVFLMLGLCAFYLAFVAIGYKYVQTDLLARREWSLSLIALPIAFISFAFQGIIPTLVDYMDRDAAKIRKAILFGSLIPLVTYIIWQWLILGIVPVDGPHGLAEALRNEDTAVQPLKHFIGSPLVYIFGQFFAFFALVTSFFGVTLGLLDFLADGFNIPKTSKGKLLLCLMIFVPPLIISMTHPNVFLTALGYAGGYGSALLLGLMPILMIWSARYIKNISTQPQLSGGKPLLVIMTIFVLTEIVLEMMRSF